MTTGVLCDTSFLITLSDPNRQHHAAAKQYYRHCLDVGRIPLFLSTLVAAEYGIGQPITDLKLDDFRVLPFTLPHAIKAAEFNFKRLRDPGDGREVVKEDVKILAQATVENISHLLTEDARTLFKYTEQLCLAGKTRVRSIKLVDGFDVSWFGDGQKQMSFVPGGPPLSLGSP